MIIDREKAILVPEWTKVRPFWPVSDVDGNWLICADIERRLVAVDEFEYRGVFEGI